MAWPEAWWILAPAAQQCVRFEARFALAPEPRGTRHAAYRCRPRARNVPWKFHGRPSRRSPVKIPGLRRFGLLSDRRRNIPRRVYRPGAQERRGSQFPAGRYGTSCVACSACSRGAPDQKRQRFRRNSGNSLDKFNGLLESMRADGRSFVAALGEIAREITPASQASFDKYKQLSKGCPDDARPGVTLDMSQGPVHAGKHAADRALLGIRARPSSCSRPARACATPPTARCFPECRAIHA